MGSLIPGYEYDIFISYRQKDNKGDRWVSEFVEALKTELESTFKEEISVYFDINPHDGLLETHDVDASLKDKLKCLVFIPIISRTYCDPKSFAWEHEFKAFVEQASQNQFGLKVKLPNGNVANRILPIQIHEITADDKAHIENELGGVLRAIEFIYKELGVNKPLTANDDEKLNLNKTKYLIQINKVANAIDEIIHSLKGKQTTTVDRKISSDQPYHDTQQDTNKEQSVTAIIARKSKKWLIMLLSLVLCIIGAFAVFKIIEGSKKAYDIAKLEKSIAVLPFVNDSPDQQNTYFINGIMNEIISDLQKIKDFKVLSRTSVEKYRGSIKLSFPEIAKDLDVNYIVEGSGQKYGNTFRLQVQLIAAKNGKNLWGESYEQEIKETRDIFKIQSQVAQAIATELKASITPDEKQLIEKVSTTNLTAYDFYQRGKEEFFKFGLGAVVNREAVKRAEILFKKALENDHTFALAYAGLGEVYWKKNYYEENYSKNFLDSMRILADKALSYDDKLAEAYYISGGYYWEKGNNEMAEKEFDKAIRFDPNLLEAYFEKAMLYYYDGDLVGSIENLQKAASRNRGTLLPELLRGIASFYYEAGFPEKGKDFNLEALNLDGDTCKYYCHLAEYEKNNGNYSKALELLTKVNQIDSTCANLGTQFSEAYMYSGQFTESLKYLKRWVEEGKAGHILTFYGSLHEIGYVYWVNGYKYEAKYYFNRGIEYFNSIIKSPHPDVKYLMAHYCLACIYAIRGDKAKSYENLKIFDQKQRFMLRFVSFIKNDPFFDNFRNEPQFRKIVIDMEAKYQAEHERVRKWLEDQGKL